MNLKSAPEIVTEILFSGMHSVGLNRPVKSKEKKVVSSLTTHVN